MKHQELKNFLRDKLKSYIKEHYDVDKFGINIITKYSENDVRLSYIAQTYYESVKNDKYVKKLMPFHGGKRLLDPKNKYIIEYRRNRDSLNNAKMFYIDKINALFKGTLNFYKMGKMIDTSPSNIKYCFEGDTTKLSHSKLKELFLKSK